MAGGHYRRHLVTGKSGAGKSTFMRDYIRRDLDEGVVKQLIIVNRKTEHSHFCDTQRTVSGTGNPGELLKDHERIFFYVTAPDPKPFMEALCSAMLKERFPRLLVIDEAQNFCKRGALADSLFRLNLEGREAMINLLLGSPLLKAQSGGIDLSMMDQLTHITAFRMHGKGNLERLYGEEFFSELQGEAHKLAMPYGGPPEYATKDRETGRAVAMLRSQQASGGYVLEAKDITQDHQGGAFL